MDTFNREKLRIRNMTDSDVEPVISIYWADIPMKEIVTSHIRGRDNISLVAEYEGILVGFILARLAYVGMPMVGVGLMHAIAVKTDYQQHGIGTLLIEELRKNCKAAGVQIIRALIPKDDTDLKKYAEDLGFLPSNTINFDRLCSD